MDAPYFSIITVTRDNIAGLKKTYDSLAAQTFIDYEWIVIDGKSSDGTTNFLEKKTALWISEPDCGIYDAMNKGIERAKGLYLIFMNAGDCFSNENLLKFIARETEKTKPDFIYGDALEDINEKYYYKKSKPHKKINCGMFTHHQAMVYGRNVFEKFRYNTDYQISADYDLTFRVLMETDDVLFIPFPFCIFESGGISQRRVLQGRKEQFDIRKKYGISPIKNTLIFVGQSVVYRFRKLFPFFYWRLKRRKQERNIATLIAQARNRLFRLGNLFLKNKREEKR